MQDDAELLRRYASEKSEAAFAELVRRHLNLVYSVALRQVAGDAHLAEDVAQKVFTDLARKAAALAERPALSGWLYRSTHFAASDVVRLERRRRAREQEAHIMDELSSSPSPASAVEWDRVRPTIDAAIAELDERDRDAVLLRFFTGCSFADIGARLRLTENAARMRVERALDKLHASLARRGVTSTTAALGIALANQAGTAAPAGLAASVTGAALAGGAAGASGAVTAAIIFMKAKTTLAAAVAVLAIGVSLYEFTALRRARAAAGDAEAGWRGHLEAAQQRLAAADKQNATLQREVEAVRAAISFLGFKPTLASPPTPASSPAPTPPTLSAEAKAVASGFYLRSGSTTREEARANSARSVDTAYAPLYRELNLTPGQSEQLRNLLLDCDENGKKLLGKAVAEARARNPNFDRADQFEVFEVLNAQIETEQQAAVRQALGEAAALALERFQSTGPARVVANQVVGALANSEAPLAPGQTEQLVALVAAQARNAAGRVELPALNVEALMAQAQGWLQPAQLAALRTVAVTAVAQTKAEREFNTAPAAALKAARK